jgi:IS5 family transposase
LPTIEDTQKLTARERGYVDHDTENPRRIVISGQKRSVFGFIKREAATPIEPVIGHMKADGHLGRCYLKGRAGDPASALSAVRQNF